MNTAQRIPISLKVVAALFILSGVSSLIEIIVSLLYGHINLNFGVLGIFIGLGLLRLDPFWRKWALVFTWIALIGVPLVGLFFLATTGPLDFRLFGQKMGHVPKIAGVAPAVVIFLVALWQYRVLTRPDVRALFQRPAVEPVADWASNDGLSEPRDSAGGPGGFAIVLHNMKNHFWCLVVMLALVILLGQTAIALWLRNSELESELKRVYANEVVIKAIDAETREAIPVALTITGKVGNQRWPDYSISSTGAQFEVRVRWIDIAPLSVVVSSAGYSERTLSLDRESEKRIEVPLSKLAAGGE